MKVSVIVAVYNGRNTIKKMLDSLMNQTFLDWECIVVDDGSNDGTSEFLDLYSNDKSNVTIIHKAKNEGVGSARITGMQHSKGEYIINVDSDDWVEPDFVECLYNEITQSNSDFAWCDVYDNDETMHIWRFDNGLDISRIIKRLLAHDIAPAQWNRIVKRNVALSNACYLEGLQDWEDLVFNIACLLSSHKISYIPKALYHYSFANPASLCHTTDKRIMVVEHMRAITNLSKAFSFYEVEKEYEKGMIWNKLLTIRDYIDDLRVRNASKFIGTYPEAIVHLWEFPEYPKRVKMCYLVILYRLPWMVPIICKFDSQLRKIGLIKEPFTIRTSIMD